MNKNVESKTHYRRVFKSDHLGVADLEDLIENKHPLIFTIASVRQEFGVKIAGKKCDKNIAYFQENIKPWALNAGSCAILKQMSGGSPSIEDWAGLTIQLYIDPNVKMKGEIVGGVRINPSAPQIQKPVLTPESPKWGQAVAAYKRDGNLQKVLERATVSEPHQLMIVQQAKDV